jgi:biopolymer transport protein ExbB
MLGIGHGWRGRILFWALSLSLLAVPSASLSGQEPPTNLQRNERATRVAPPGRDGSDATAKRSVLSVWKRGGPILIPISGCSFLLFLFIFERVICLRRARVIPRPFVKRFIEQLLEEELKQMEALQLCRENRSPVAEVFAAAVKKWGRPSVEVEQAVLDTGERVANHLRRYLRLFHGISTISPLLGLLGTVLGMINSFNTVAASDAMGRPELLAAGISEALITTASGLCVAIPAIIAHMYFVSRVDGLIMEIDALGQKVVNAIASDGWCEKSEKKSVKVLRSRAA